MKIKNKIRLWSVALLVIPFVSSCADWLAVDMEDAIMEDKLYQTNDGFLSSLNGVYTKMNENYSSVLSMGAIDVMAQYYDIPKDGSHKFSAFADYKADQYKGTSNSLWINQYALIANLNTLLEHCDAAGAAINKLYYPYVKGEALALRAFFHFDLLRIYGPIYSESTAGNITIPYEETSSKDIQPLLTAKEVMNKVIRDLKAASELLENDRIRTEGVMNGESEDPNEGVNLRYRQYRMNYYAVQALLVRAYMWIGDKKEAYRIATTLIKENEENETFPWTPKNAVNASTNPDLVFSKEVIFSLFNTSRNNLYNGLFNKSVSAYSALVFQGGTMEEGNADSKLTHYFDDMGDLRRECMWSVESIDKIDANGGVTATEKKLCLRKYEGVTASAYRYMIPLMRMSEVYLTAAECTDNLTEAIGYVNAIRSARNCMNITLIDTDTKERVMEYVTNEFMREMIGEGQLYFYYKRHATPTILAGNGFEEDWWDGTALRAERTMSMSDYVWPMPEVEMDKRMTSKQ